ncbi:class I SAM-dependent methyltransferase [Rossellomorea vietnamensis]|uniref:Class I SAM-dependent methyltransferase n=1 Tax=Rossellomorea vietnamensis TaxID=218284 RepID=A0A5D4KH16_9BACI|nr:class I SAM-dependent methyltransferase [Rossellomorea vietnamensis]
MNTPKEVAVLLNLTGERVIPEKMDPMNGMLLEHLARYYFAIEYSKGRVLDISCGTGYGSKIIAKAQKAFLDEIIAVDNDEETLHYAKSKHYHPLIQYTNMNAEDPELPGTLGQFDCIISFETLEHLYHEEIFMNNLYQMLKPGGTLIISTPFGAGRGQATNEKYHVHQLTEKEFTGLFNDYSEEEFYYQRSVLVEPKREGKHYPFGIAVCKK